MKRFINWLKSDSQRQSAAKDAEQAPVGVRSENDDSSFSWTEIDQADSSIFDTGSLNIEKSEDQNAPTNKTPDLEGDSLCSAEKDVGVDPYNTGRFDTEKK